MRALVAKLIRKCLREVKRDMGSSTFEKEIESLEHFRAELSNFLAGERDVHAGVRSAEM
jgi:hypothetical protein